MAERYYQDGEQVDVYLRGETTPRLGVVTGWDGHDRYTVRLDGEEQVITVWVGWLRSRRPSWGVLWTV